MELTLTELEVKENPFCDAEHKAAFYRLFAQKAYGLAWDDVTDLDCRKVVVSGDIQDAWYQNRPKDITAEQLTMLLAFNGPKADYDFPPRTVRFDADCIKNGGKNEN